MRHQETDTQRSVSYEKNSVMLIGTYGNRRSCVRMGGPLQTDQMGLEVKHNGTVQIEGRQNRAVHH